MSSQKEPFTGYQSPRSSLWREVRRPGKTERVLSVIDRHKENGKLILYSRMNVLGCGEVEYG